MSITSSLKSIGHDIKKVAKDEAHIVSKSAKQAVKDTFGVGTAAGAGVSYHESKKSGKTAAVSAKEAGKGAAKGAALDLAINFTGHMIDNQLKYNHKYW